MVGPSSRPVHEAIRLVMTVDRSFLDVWPQFGDRSYQFIRHHSAE